MKTANDPEAVRIEQLRSLFKAWVVRQPKKQPGMADTTVLKFHGWMLKHRPKLRPHEKGDSYQHLKSDLKGLIDDVS